MGIARTVKQWGPAALWLAAPIGLVSQPAHVSAQTQAEFNIPAGRLSSAIRQVSRQARVSVATSDRGVRQVRSRAVRGRMTTAEALRRLLDGTPYRAVVVRGGAYRIERRPPPRRVARAAPAAPVVRRPPPPPPPPPRPIIVEATKRSAAPTDYAGGIRIVDLNRPGLLPAAASLDDTLATVPSVSGTALGSGRNKIFLRGIADSSFNGPTQSTIGLYLGEQRVIFSAPNPDLRLVDVEAVELLEGPQGSLYGAGTLAGLLRVNPRAPDPSAFEGEGWVSGAYTSSGNASWDVGGVVNLPVTDGSALRVVGYGGETGGYIDNIGGQGQSNINEGTFYGGRAAFGIELGPDWNLDLSAFGQHQDVRDGQYVGGRLPDLSRRGRVAQPFANRVYGGALTVRGYLGGAELVSSTGMVDNNLRSTFDSSTLVEMPMARQFFRETRDIRLITHETRLSGGDPETFNWLVGVGALRDRNDVAQIIENLSDAPDPPPFARQKFRLDEVALFGEASHRFAPQFSATAGARLLYTRTRSERLFGNDPITEDRNGPARLLPAAALSWHPSRDVIVYARYQQGYRTGGVTIERQPNGEPDDARFDPDQIRSYEVGVRGSAGGPVRVTYAATLHHSDWRDIQADLIDAQGFPITRNIGDGRVTGLDANLGLLTRTGWRIDLAAAYNDSTVDRVLPDQQGILQTTIPNVPEFAANARVAKEWEWDSGDEGGVAFTARYTGRSFLDLDQQVREPQGDFGSLDLAAWWQRGDFELRIEAENITDTRGNRFAFGNPFTARREMQETPLRPFTVRAQISFRR